MQITLNTAESSTDELTALIALLASLGGRLPTTRTLRPDFAQTDQPSDTFDEYAEINQGRRGPPSGMTDRAAPVNEVPSESPIQTDFDSKGTPWDARIHSESKATVADGSWRKRRGVSDELFNQVMTEIKDAALIGHPDEDDAPPPPPADEEVPLAPADQSDVPMEDEPSAPEPAANAPAAGDGQFADFPAFVGAVSKHGKTYAELNEMAGTLGVPMFKDMKDHADKWDIFFSMIG